MKVSDPSAPFNPNPSGLSEIHACAVHVQILTEFKCQVRMTAPDLRAQVCPLPLLVDAETQFRGRKSVCKSFDNRTPAVWFSLFRDLALNSHMTQTQLLVWAGWAVCLADYPYAQHESAKVAWECWRLPETASSIVHYFPLLFLPSRHTTIYTQRIIQVFLLAVGCDWLYGPNMAESDWLTAREGRELWKGRPRFKAGMQKIIGVLFHMEQVDIMNCWHHMTSMQLASN